MTAQMLDSLLIVETPEGVQLSLHLAGFVPRTLAFIVDLLVRGCLVVALAMSLSNLGRLGQGLLLLALFLLEWLYYVLFEVYARGATPGKWLIGLTVVETSGLPIGWRASLVRNLLRFADFLPFLYAFATFSLLHTRYFQRLGDLTAGTVVVWRQKKQAIPSLPEVAPLEPPCRLSSEEQRSLIDFAARCHLLSRDRQIELANLLRPLTGTQDAAGLEKLLGMANHVAGKR